MRDASLVLVLASLLAGCGCSPSPSRPAPSALVDTATVAQTAELVPTLGFADEKLREHDDYSEMVVVRGKLADGGSLYAKLRINNIGPAHQEAEFRISLSPLEGEKAALKYKRDDPDDWTYTKGAFEVDLEGAKTTVDGRIITMVASRQGTRIELKVESSEAPLRPVGANDIIGGDRIYQATILAPRATFTATVTRPDQAPQTLTGVAWAEHWLSTVVPHNLAIGFHTVLDLQPDRVVSAWGVKTVPALGDGVAGWLLVIRDGQPMVFEPKAQFAPADVRKDGKTGYGVPHGLAVTGAGHTLTLTSPDGPKRKDDLGRLNAFQRMVVERLTKPFSFRFDDTPYTVKGESGETTGAARYIYQQLN